MPCLTTTPEPRSILVVDDEPGIRHVMEQFFSRRGYQCRTAESGPQALSLLHDSPSQAVLSDIEMDGMNGLEVTRRVLQASPKTVVVLMTGKTDVALAIEALRLGVSDFLLKPFGLETAQRSVERAVLMKQALRSMEHELAGMQSSLQNSLQHGKKVTTAITEAFHRMHRLRDLETSGHSARVSRYAVRLAQKMGLSTSEQEDLRSGALLHDIGKVVIPDHILMKSSPLTEEEWCIIREHTEAGFSILAGVPGLEGAARIVLEHHERYDGRGYPRGLRGDEICRGARIFAVADTYDAVTSDRPYRRAQSDAAAREEIRRYSGTQFDPRIVEAFLGTSPEEWLVALSCSGEDPVTSSLSQETRVPAGGSGKQPSLSLERKATVSA
ncbi:MAG: response regulator [Acidobacteria bacterium]|nr:response regulator [Acidobacteriota bacterium]